MTNLREATELVLAEITRSGPKAAFDSLIAANDTLILSPDLGDGREIAMARTAVHCGIMDHWAAGQHTALGYGGEFALVALGGTGRGEMTPCSDTDFAFLFDDALEGNAFLLELQDQAVHKREEFKEQFGFSGEVFPFNFDSIPELDEKQLNAFLDMHPVYDPDGLAEKFRGRIRETYDPFGHFLHASRFWRDHWAEPTGEHERLDEFDIKIGGLRIFLAGVWALAGEGFRHSHEIYAELPDRRVLDAYGLLLRIRSFVHLRKGTRNPPTGSGKHLEDVLAFDDFTAFGEMLGEGADDWERFAFANMVRQQLMDGRRRIDRFTWGVVGRALKEGRRIRPGSAIVYGIGGLRDTAPDRTTPEEKSRAALAILLTAQRHRLPVDPFGMETTFRDAGDWLEPVLELGGLFYERRGSLADSLEILSQLPGAMERLFPGYAKFESSLDGRVMTEKKSLRGALMREKIRALESDLRLGQEQIDHPKTPHKLADTAFEISTPLEAASLDDDHLAAVKLALVTKRLPETLEDMATWEDRSLPLHERFSSGLSGIPLAEYYQRCFSGCGFGEKALEVACSLVENRRKFQELAERDFIDAETVDEIVRACRDEEALLRAQFVFTCADRTEWESEAVDPARWFIIRELYGKALVRFRGDQNPIRKLTAVGFPPEHTEILQDLGPAFFKGSYRHYAIRLGGHIIRLHENSDAPPKVARIHAGFSEIVAMVARDHAGIAASISGAFWDRGVRLRQAHLFSTRRYGLALDFFHLAPRPEGESSPGPDFDAAVVDAIATGRYIGEEDAAAVPDVAAVVTLEISSSGLVHLRAETGSGADTGALIYALTYRIYLYLKADICGLAAHTGKGRARVSVYLNLPPELGFERAKEIVARWKG